jgi:acetylxylan esterase
MSCDYEDIAYDAYSSDYCPSVAAGERLALQQINAYYAKCPESAIVLSGYSEGATVMGNAGLTTTTSGVSCNIAAVTLFGNPRHTADQPYNVLTGTAGQANSHRDAAGLARLASYTPRLADYCNVDDLICATGLGADTVEAHTNYFELYSEEAAQYIAGLVKGYSKDKYCPVATSSSSSSASASATSSASASSVSASDNATAPTLSSSYSSPASVPYITATEISSIYTTVCPQSSAYTAGNLTRTTTWTGPSTVTTSLRSTTTMIVPGTYIPSPSAVKPSSMTTLNGTPAVIQYTTTISTTTYANFPTLTITVAVPTATQWLNGQDASNGNGTKPTGYVASGTGAGSAHPTSTAPITPYTGAASSSGVAAKWLAIAAGVVGLMTM